MEYSFSYNEFNQVITSVLSPGKKYRPPMNADQRR